LLPSKQQSLQSYTCSVTAEKQRLRFCIHIINYWKWTSGTTLTSQLSTKDTKIFYEIWGFEDGKYEEHCLLLYDALQDLRNSQIFRRSLFQSFSWLIPAFYINFWLCSTISHKTYSSIYIIFKLRITELHIIMSHILAS
jgi:hypothetical protein